MIEFSYFDRSHLASLALALLFATLFIAAPIFLPGKKIRLGQCCGCFIFLLTIMEAFYRVCYEGFSVFQAMPFHFCSVSLLAAGFYLALRKDFFFQITYYYAFGAGLAIILPGIENYRHPLFLYLFILTHMLVIAAGVYGVIWLQARPTGSGLALSIGILAILCPLAYFYNSIYFTNFMFMNAYIIKQAEIVRPFWLYRLLFFCTSAFIMCAFYLPFRKKH